MVTYMKFPNFFRLNDWPKKKFITLLFSLQISVLGLILLDMVGLEFPILRYLVCFFYLTFLPGILILRIFNFHELGDIETTLYSVGLSISFLMFIGFFCNITFPIFGIINPLSTTHLIVIILLAITFLCTVCYVIDKYSNMQPSYRINFDNSLYLFLLLPILSILGALVKNFFGLNLVLITLIILICICFILIGFEIIDKKSTYPIFIFLISLSLLYHTSLISGYLWGTDIHLEFYISNLVKNFGYCNFSTHDNLYSVLSVTILAPIYSSFLNIDIKWLFKAIYPLVFSFVPLRLFLK
jgi:uncharacterized membrane protein